MKSKLLAYDNPKWNTRPARKIEGLLCQLEIIGSTDLAREILPALLLNDSQIRLYWDNSELIRRARALIVKAKMK
jgi:hypothetical protein